MGLRKRFRYPIAPVTAALISWRRPRASAAISAATRSASAATRR